MDASRVGYSVMGVMFCMGFCILMLIGLVGLGFRSFGSGDRAMPLVRSCSAAIAAACHRPDTDAFAYKGLVRWGVVGEAQGEREVGHCCFTTASDVHPPISSKLYEGLSETL